MNPCSINFHNIFCPNLHTFVLEIWWLFKQFKRYDNLGASLCRDRNQWGWNRATLSSEPTLPPPLLCGPPPHWGPSQAHLGLHAVVYPFVTLKESWFLYIFNFVGLKSNPVYSVVICLPDLISIWACDSEYECRENSILFSRNTFHKSVYICVWIYLSLYVCVCV